MDDLESLTERAHALTRRRDELRSASLAAREELERRRRETASEVRAHRRTPQRRSWAVAVPSILLLYGLAAFAWYRFDFVRPEERSFRVVAVEGHAPTEQGDVCEARIETHILFGNTTWLVDCGGQRIYGSRRFGYEHVRCETRGARAWSCADDLPIARDASPRLRLDGPSGRLVLDDGERWRATLAPMVPD